MPRERSAHRYPRRCGRICGGSCRTGLNEVSGFDDLLEFDVTPTDRQRRKEARNAGRSFVEACMFVGDKFGAATTHWTKLQDRLARGVGSPLFLVGIPVNVVNG